MRRLLREPLLHFVLLGAGLFAVYSMTAKPGRSGAPTEIVVTSGQIEHLAAGFARTWQRAPSEAELKGLIDEWVREEIATREAIALGLDRDDTVIRRRLRQKLEFVSEDVAAQAEPTDAELGAYLQAHPESFRVEPRFTFSQVYLSREKHGDHLARDAARLLAELQRAGDGAEWTALGDSLLLEPSFAEVPGSEIAKLFGERFAADLERLPVGPWGGPIESGYGLHLVRVEERTEGRLPELAEVRELVRREWANARRVEANATFYREMLKRYTVTIERPKADEGAAPK